ncbi:hypothetical protein HK101_003600, partial [Irineochytrium annulatum]
MAGSTNGRSCTVLYFASARDAAGVAQDAVALDDVATAASSGSDASVKPARGVCTVLSFLTNKSMLVTLRSLIAHVVSKHAGLASVLKTAMVAVNMDYVDRELWIPLADLLVAVDQPDLDVKAGDEIAIIPP